MSAPLRKVKIHARRVRCAKVTASLRPVKSPTTNKVKAYRLVAVIPNQDQFNIHTEEYSTSFRQKYHIAWMGDWIKPPDQRILRMFELGLQQMPICAKEVNWE